MENMNGQTTQAENMGNETEVQGAAGKERLFTQDEVNSFVKSQVARMMKKSSKDQEADYNQKLAELQAREQKLLVKEMLQERGMAKELADIITCTDEDDLNNKLNALEKIYGKAPAAKETGSTGFIQIGASGGNSDGSVKNFNDSISKAMGLS